jgi:hypothetical protein
MRLAHDFGVSAPSVTFVTARSPGAEGPDGHYYPRESILLLDELSTNEPGSLVRGLGWTVPRLAEEIVELCDKWHMTPFGYADRFDLQRQRHDKRVNCRRVRALRRDL